MFCQQSDMMLTMGFQDPDSNPYGLGEGVKYYMLEVEDWTQPGISTKRKGSAFKKASDQVSISPPDRPISPPPAVEPESDVSAAESLGATRSPTSHLFPVRKRANSLTAGPSSLSRLLAQASPSPESTTNEGEASPAERPRSPSPSPAPNLGLNRNEESSLLVERGRTSIVHVNALARRSIHQQSVQSSPIQSKPIQSNPVHSSPLQSTPIQYNMSLLQLVHVVEVT